jgi:valyl-tRNA synthetase
MDTWATSSHSPQIIGHWEEDDDLYQRVFPCDLRPQAHEIIRTWLFYTIVRSHIHFDVLPWSDAAISGFVVDPERKKMSKSAGNATDDPTALLDEYGSDAIRYWAAGGRPGQDVALDRNQFKIGRRLAIKILNASKFALSLPRPEAAGIPSEPLDLAMLGQLGRVIDEVTAAFEGYDWARAMERAETFFWSFCDDYLELVKNRAYAGGPAGASAIAALELALSAQLRLFAPFLPYVTEEVWSWWQEGSIHRAAWPAAEGLPSGDPLVLDAAAAALAAIRKAKSEAKVSMRAAVAKAVVRDTAQRIAALRAAEADLRDAGSVADLVLQEGEPGVDVELAPPA